MDVCLVDELGPAPRVAACHQSRRTAIKTEIYPGKTMQNVFSTTLLGKHVGSIQATALLSFLDIFGMGGGKKMGYVWTRMFLRDT